MYRPEKFKVDNIEIEREFIKSYPLGVFISNSENSLDLNYLPFVFESSGEDYFLIGHMARANPQWKHLDGNAAVVSFQGPDRYISPSWYKTANQVPTWNYAAVEVRGRVELLHSYEKIEEILSKSVLQFEEQNQTTWNYNLSEDLRRGMVAHIVGIKIHIEKIEGKFKLSQNRHDSDFQGVAFNLGQSTRTSDQEMLSWIRKLS